MECRAVATQSADHRRHADAYRRPGARPRTAAHPPQSGRHPHPRHPQQLFQRFHPWGTYLTCEENWVGYFSTQDSELPRELTRYGIRNTSRFGWETLAGDEFERFDATRKGKQAQDDYRNEPNNFGWIVEIDPFDPQSVPVKRTALGRFAHEGLVFARSSRAAR